MGGGESVSITTNAGQFIQYEDVSVSEGWADVNIGELYQPNFVSMQVYQFGVSSTLHNCHLVALLKVVDENNITYYPTLKIYCPITEEGESSVSFSIEIAALGTWKVVSYRDNWIINVSHEGMTATVEFLQIYGWYYINGDVIYN